MSDWTPPDAGKPKRFNLARPRWWTELFAIVLILLQLGLLVWADFRPVFILVGLALGALLFVGGSLIWKPLNYLIAKPDRVVIKAWSFSKTEDKREIPYEELEEIGVDAAAGILWLRYAPTHRWEDDSEEPGGVITFRISPAREAKDAAEAIEEGRRRILPYLEKLDAELKAARAASVEDLNRSIRSSRKRPDHLH